MNLRELAFFYHNLVIAFNAGINLIQSFESLSVTEKNSNQKRKIRFVLEALRRGEPLASAFKKSGFVPLADVPLIEVGEKTGKLSYVFKLLQKNYEVSASAERAIKTGLVLPAFIFICAVFLPSLPELFTEKITITQYLTKNFLILGIVYSTARLFHIFFLKSYYNERWARRRYDLFEKIPILADLSRRMANEKFCTALELNLQVGQNMFDALKIAGQVSADPELNLASRRIIAEVKSGRTLPEAFAMESVISVEIIRSIEIGSESGEIPRLLNEAAQRMKTEIYSSILKVSAALPVLLYWTAMAYAASTILSLYLKSAFALIKLF